MLNKFLFVAAVLLLGATPAPAPALFRPVVQMIPDWNVMWPVTVSTPR